MKKAFGATSYKSSRHINRILNVEKSVEQCVSARVRVCHRVSTILSRSVGLQRIRVTTTAAQYIWRIVICTTRSCIHSTDVLKTFFLICYYMHLYWLLIRYNVPIGLMRYDGLSVFPVTHSIPVLKKKYCEISFKKIKLRPYNNGLNWNAKLNHYIVFPKNQNQNILME